MVFDFVVEPNHKFVQLLAKLIVDQVSQFALLLVLVAHPVLFNLAEGVFDSHLHFQLPLLLLLFTVALPHLADQLGDLLVGLGVEGEAGPEFFQVLDACDEEEDDVLLGVADPREEILVLQDVYDLLGYRALHAQEDLHLLVLHSLNSRVNVVWLQELQQLVELEVERVQALLVG